MGLCLAGFGWRCVSVCCIVTWVLSVGVSVF